MGGLKLYKVLHLNMGLPSESSVYKYIQQNENFVEGKIRAEELSHFLSKRGLKRIIWLSEDATKIVERVCKFTILLILVIDPVTRVTSSSIF